MSSKIPLLTIAIPTYNRSSSLKYIVDKIINYTSSDLKLLIIDNNSSDDTRDYTAYLNKKHGNNITCLRNHINLGGCVNMLRCIEFSESKYVWLLGDDDDIDVEYLNELMEQLSRENSSSFHLLPKSRQSRKIVHYQFNNKKDFENEFYDITALHLMSSNIYKVDDAKKYLDKAYRLVHLQHPFSLFHAKFLEERKVLKILKIPILKEERIPIKRWSKFIAHIDALETTYILFGRDLACKEFNIRKDEILRVGIISLFDNKNEGFQVREVNRIIRLVSIKQWFNPLICLIILSLNKRTFSKYILVYSIISIYFFKYNNKYKEALIEYLRIPKSTDLKLHLNRIFNISKENIFKN